MISMTLIELKNQMKAGIKKFESIKILCSGGLEFELCTIESVSLTGCLLIFEDEFNFFMDPFFKFKDCELHNLSIISPGTVSRYSLYIKDSVISGYLKSPLNLKIVGEKDILKNKLPILYLQCTSDASIEIDAMQTSPNRISAFKITLKNSSLKSCTLDSKHIYINNCDNIKEVDFKQTYDTISIENSKFFDSIWYPKDISTLFISSTIFGKGCTVYIDSLTNILKSRDTLDIHKATVIDKWLELRKHYTGTGLLWIVLFAIVFILPYAVRVSMYSTTTPLVPIQSSVLIDAFFDYTSAFFDEDPLLIIDDELIEIRTQSLFTALFIGPYESLLSKILYFASSSLVIIYNFLKFYMTMTLSRLREEEEYLTLYKFQVTRPADSSLTWFYNIDFYTVHKICNFLFWGTVMVSGFKIFELLTVCVIKF